MYEETRYTVAQKEIFSVTARLGTPTIPATYVIARSTYTGDPREQGTMRLTECVIEQIERRFGDLTDFKGRLAEVATMCAERTKMDKAWAVADVTRVPLVTHDLMGFIPTLRLTARVLMGTETKYFAAASPWVLFDRLTILGGLAVLMSESNLLKVAKHKAEPDREIPKELDPRIQTRRDIAKALAAAQVKPPTTGVEIDTVTDQSTMDDDLVMTLGLACLCIRAWTPDAYYDLRATRRQQEEENR